MCIAERRKRDRGGERSTIASYMMSKRLRELAPAERERSRNLVLALKQDIVQSTQSLARSLSQVHSNEAGSVDVVISTNDAMKDHEEGEREKEEEEGDCRFFVSSVLARASRGFLGSIV